MSRGAFRALRGAPFFFRRAESYAMNAFLIEYPRDPTDAQSQRISSLAAECREFGEVMVTPFRYDLAANSEIFAGMRRFVAEAQRVFVLGFQFPRAQRWTLASQGIMLSDAVFVDVREEEFSPEKYGALAYASCSDVREISEVCGPRWYPVLDASRCVNCKACLNFCLFGVYDTDREERIFVESPDSCRPGCPACARICPRKAILFPMCEEEAIAGKYDPVEEMADELADEIDRW